MITAGPGLVLSAFRVGDIAHIADEREVEELVGGLDQSLPPVEDLGVHPEYGGDVDGEGAVDIDRDIRDLAVAVEPVQAVDQLLRPTHGKGGNQQLPSPIRHPAHRGAQPRLGVVERLVVPVGIGRFDHQSVDRSRRRLRVSDDGKAAPADVTGKDQPLRAALGYPEVNRGRAEDMARPRETRARGASGDGGSGGRARPP